MDPVKIFCILCLVLICRGLESSEHYKSSQELCKRVARDPYFDVDIVVGKSWRTYHTWNIDPEYRINTEFTKPTQKMVERIRMEMADYMEHEPNWEAAVLHLTNTLEYKTSEALLFADQGAAGSFLAVPILTRELKSDLLMRKSATFIRLQMKLVHHGKYLLMMDCNCGGGSLAARSDDKPNLAEMASEAAALSKILNMGDGYSFCVK